MKKLLILGFLVLCPALRAQPCVKVTLTQNGTRWQECLPVTHKTADRSFWDWVLVSQAATATDVENSMYALRRAGTVEVNPLFGRARPTRAQYYAVSEASFAVNTYWAWRFKREDDALRAAGYAPHKLLRWWLSPLVNVGLHSAAIGVTIGFTGR